MGLLDDVLQSDGAAFVDTDVFGETVTYTFRDGTTRSVKAVVERQQQDVPTGRQPVGSQPMLKVYIRNHGTLGVLASEIDTGGDKITVARRYGSDSTQDYLVHRPEQQDNGMWLFPLG